MKIRAIIAAGVFAGAFTAPVLVGAGTATAAPCVGENGREMVGVPTMTSDGTQVVKEDSCRVQETIKGLGDGADWVGKAGDEGAVAPKPAGFVFKVGGQLIKAGGNFDKRQLESCAQPGKGVTYRLTNGLVTSCSPQ
ncbi:hypothetical protein AXK56_04055 [Tsukamurella pulmonis]|uniref:Secreted protein n=1 Tax=Tsukamurella pulmonis TaxID=47312 RepID=A0A1H1DQG8_9ACTN|nr:hypothetical protein [Tsukamurella pulmonis]KXO92260.1 hypothetical protein AXK56_04055 [Tsukamurella pulmonis]SDQ78106.1 hypothetical protein SAMN04489765_1817 [Tsukamurella pulmonis]SUP21864.1 Uncharacterised protein [Tsukamurella pulmonis]